MNIQNRNQLSCKQGSVDVPVPLRIKITYIPFLILLVLKIGSANSVYFEKLSYIVFFIWFLSCITFNLQTVITILKQKHYAILFIFLIYYFILGSVINGVFTAMKSLGGFIQHLSPIFMYEFYSIFENKKNNRMFLIMITGILIFFSIKAILALETDPLIARAIVAGNVNEEMMIGGGYSLAYALAIIVPALLYFIISKNDKNPITVFKNIVFEKTQTLIMLLIVIFFCFVVIKSMYAISLLILIVGCFYAVLVASFTRNKLLFGILIFLTITSLFLNQLLIHEFINYLNKFDPNLLIRKLIEVSDYIQNASDSYIDIYGSFGGRISMYFDSLNVFLDNIIWGIAYKYELNQDMMMSAGLGNHSEWFDTLARYGIFGILYIWFLISVKKTYWGQKGFMIAYSIFFILGFFNPIHLFTIFFATFYFVPKLNKYFMEASKA